MGWAKRLKRVFGIDIQICSRCGGKVKVISAIEEASCRSKDSNSIGERITGFQNFILPEKPPEPDNELISLFESSFHRFIDR